RSALRTWRSSRPGRSTPGGRPWSGWGRGLLIETGERQAAPAAEAVAAAGLDARVAYCEDFDATAVIGTVPAAGRNVAR
ncbi:hypothetical protein ACWDR9_38295, partial [Streptosporangium sandarakinum]